MSEKFKVGDRVRVVKCGELMGEIGQVNGAHSAICVIVFNGRKSPLAFFDHELAHVEDFKVGDWIEFPDVGDTTSWGRIESIHNGFATVSYRGDDSNHWKVRLAGSGVRHRAAPMFEMFGAKRMTDPIERPGVQFLAEIPPGYEGAHILIIKAERVLLVHPDRPVLLFDEKYRRWTEPNFIIRT